MDDVSILIEGTIKKNENKKESIDINDHHHRMKNLYFGSTHQSKKGLVRWEEKSFFLNNEPHHRPVSSIRHGNKFHQRRGNQTLNLFFVSFFDKNKKLPQASADDEVVRTLQQHAATTAPRIQKRQQERSIYTTAVKLLFDSSFLVLLFIIMIVCLLFSRHFLPLAFYVHLSSSDTAQTYNAISTLHSKSSSLFKGEIKFKKSVESEWWVWKERVLFIRCCCCFWRIY